MAGHLAKLEPKCAREEGIEEECDGSGIKEGQERGRTCLGKEKGRNPVNLSRGPPVDKLTAETRAQVDLDCAPPTDDDNQWSIL